MPRQLRVLLLLAACARTAPSPAAFEPEIRAFEAADRSTPPAPGGIVFVGSSSIRNWTNVAADFPGVPILNRGFGGSTLSDVTQGRTPEQVFADYRLFVARLRAALPTARLAFVSIKPSPSRRAFLDLARP